MVRANNPSLLKEYGGDLVLTDKWVRGVLEKNTWSKHKGTTGKVDPSHQFLAKEKFTFQRNISGLVPGQDIPPSLIINIDQTPLLNVNTGKYRFSFKGAKNIPIKGVDDKHQITATFGVSYTREILPIQGKPNEVCPSILFLLLFRYCSQKITGQAQRNVLCFLKK